MMTVVHLGASMAWFGMQQILSWGLIIDHYRSELNNSVVKRGVCFDTCAHLDRSRRLWPPRAPQGFTWRMLFSISVYSIHLSNCFIFTSYSLLKFSSTNKYCGYRTPFPKGKLYTLRTFKSFFLIGHNIAKYILYNHRVCCSTYRLLQSSVITFYFCTLKKPSFLATHPSFNTLFLLIQP